MYIDDFNFGDFLIGIVVLSLSICLPIMAYNFSKNEDEKDCYNYYKENNYILDSCKVYEEKFIEK